MRMLFILCGANDGWRVSKVVHDFNREALTALFLLNDLWDDQAHLLPIAWVDFFAVFIDAGREDHLHDLEYTRQ